MILESLLDKYPVSWISSCAHARPGRVLEIEAYIMPIKYQNTLEYGGCIIFYAMSLVYGNFVP